MRDYDDIGSEKMRKRKFRPRDNRKYNAPPTCGPKHKISFRTWREAERARVKRITHGTLFLAIYKCPWCKYFHLTSQRPKA